MKIGKRFLSLAVSFMCAASIMLCGMPAVSAETGTYGAFTYEKIDEDNDGTVDYVEITDCNEYFTSVEIPNEIDGLPVTSIGYEAFKNCDGLTSITIPNGVISIGEDAFRYCGGLTSITIPDSVTSIGDGVFSGCDSLTSITVSENNQSYVSMDGVLFSKDKTQLICYPAGNSNLNYDIPDSVTRIRESAFFGCESLTSITIPGSITSIGNSAFESCKSLASITIPDSVTSIGVGAFFCCYGLTSITIPNRVTSIGDFTFYQCISLTSVTIPDSVTSIGVGAFFFCDGLTRITIPDSVTSIGKSAFNGCEGLTSVTIPDSVTSIGGSAFKSCTSLTSVTIPDSVTSIGTSAFYCCKSLTSITILNPDCKIWMSMDTICNGYNLDGEGCYYNGTICGYENSTAQAYAEEFGYKFIPIGESVKPWCMADVVKMKKYLTGIDVEITDNFDLNSDGVINIFDLMLMKREILNG